jgi:hypothetical protein
MISPVEILKETLECVAANALNVRVDEALSWPAIVEGEGLVDTTSAGLFYGHEAGNSPAS